MPRPLHEAPRMLGRYHLFEAIDEDELGELYLSRFEGPSGFQRWAVVRLLHAELAADAEMVDAFFEGARVAALVQHANVAVTFDVGRRDGPSWVAREYLHGESVEDLLSRAVDTRAHIPWDIACRVVADIAQGVETLHEFRPPGPRPIGFLRGVVTPGRAIVTYDGKTKVVEGCLPLVGGRPTLDAQAASYRPPELDPRGVADVQGEVFALGVLLWELCAGQRLFGGGPISEVRARVTSRAVPPLVSRIRCPRLIDEIVQRAVSQDPEKRQPTCRVLARELEGCLVSKGLVVSDDEVGRYMLGVFADRFEEREAGLLSAANVTEVFDRAEIAARIADLQAASQNRPEPPGDEIDDSETPEVNLAFHGMPPSGPAPSTTRSLEDPPSSRDVFPAEPPTRRRDEAETPEVTAALFVLSTRQAESVAMPLLERKALPLVDRKVVPLVERKKEPLRGFDELPTMRKESPRDAAVPRPGESVVFVGDDITVARDRRDPSFPDAPDSDPPRSDHGPRGTLRMLPEDPDEPRESSPALRVAEEAEALKTPAAGPPVPPRRGLLEPPPRPPTLSAVLIAHERRKGGRSVRPAALAALGAAAVLVVLLVYLRSRATGSEVEATVFRDTPSATAAPPPATTPVAATPWRAVPPPGAGPPEPAPPDAATTSATAPKSPAPTRAADSRRGTWRPPPTPAPAPAPTAPSGKTGLLTVLCTPACDDVLDGARSLGPSPVFKVSVGAGAHRLTLRTTDPPVKKVVNVVVNEDDTAVVRESMEAELDPRRY